MNAHKVCLSLSLLESLAALPRMAVVRLIIFKDLNYIVVLSRFCSMVVDFHVLIFVFFTSDIFLSSPLGM
jgi:hypothetical protein